ncbi:hypothetical protein KFL_000540330 [Klebsormidium nitens]|uniref:Protein N-terminal asparagine amidohydrolase n=1 Tax=Klebsormidium nitens TaxID=105231 RepID=A0A0U9HIR4_KLENI|nr:hypothetical protein KFL_000540330 [Klebsormidium nitens]|eukprot:GAQ80458.1 hypothetical protein KFL_000540330 [Klebsormidium nitens]
MLLVDGIPLGDIATSRDGNEGWDLLLTLLRHPKIVASAAAFRQQKPELIDAPEDRRTPPSPRSVHDQTVHQKEGGHTPSTPAGTWTEGSIPAEPGPKSSEGDQSKGSGPESGPSTRGPSEQSAAERRSDAGPAAAEPSGSGKGASEQQEPRGDSGQPRSGSENQSTSEMHSTIDGSASRRTVYVFQRERATVLPAFVDVVGTDEMTTCIAVALRDPETGRTSVAHIDGEDCIKSGIAAMLLSMEPVNGPLELHLVGGYDDSDEGDDEDATGGAFDLQDNPGEENWTDRGSAPGEPSGTAAAALTRGGEAGISQGTGKAEMPVPGGLGASEVEPQGPESEAQPRPATMSRGGEGGVRSVAPPRGEVSEEAHRLARFDYRSDDEGRSPSLGKRSREEEDKGSGGGGGESDSSAKAQRPSGGKGKRPAQEPGKRLVEEGSSELEARGMEEEEERYDDAVGPVMGGQSWPLAAALVGMLHRSNVCLEVKTACILGHNTGKDREVGNLSMPVVRGLGIEPKSGRAFPATFSVNARGPDGVVRGVCMMACGPDPRWQGVLTVPYQTATDSFHVGPCQYERMDSIARQMQAMDDRDLLCLTSTSPTSEGTEFLPATRKVLAFLVENPNWWDVFPFDQPRVFVRTKAGGWRRTA